MEAPIASRPHRCHEIGRNTFWTSMNKEAQLTTMFITSFALALSGWALAYLSSTRARANEEHRAYPTRLRRWLNAVYDRLLKARE